MFDTVVQNLIKIKRDFAKNYSGSAHIQEVIPSQISDDFPIDKNHLEQLHNFAEKNPIYFNSFEEDILGIPCMVYEGDINDYWLNSIKHGSSCQPFYPYLDYVCICNGVNCKKNEFFRTCRYWLR